MTDWASLEQQYGAELVAEVRHDIQSRRLLELDPDRIARHVGAPANRDSALSVLRELARDRQITSATTYVCPNCQYDLSDEELQLGECPSCEKPFASMDEEPHARERFLLQGGARRTIPWLIAVHGMNTTGAWQEEFNWRIATKYKYSAPVAIYKYGIVRPAVMLTWRQRQLLRGLGDRILALIGHAEAAGFSSRPDVIAHSFGTWLIGHLLASDDERYRRVSFGRIILTGCILRPDFDWEALIRAGRLEAVLNHYGTRDLPARLAHYFIPDSGPSGRIGFVGDGAFDVAEEGWGHSAFFAPRNLRALLDDGLWEEFLSRPLAGLPDVLPTDRVDRSWSATPAIAREVLRYAMLLVLGAVAFGIVGVMAAGVWSLLAWPFSAG
jgi:hypothetical protein